jgi:hypothetical protein
LIEEKAETRCSSTRADRAGSRCSIGSGSSGSDAQGIDFATDPVGDDTSAPIFGNRRAEMYYKASQWVKKHRALPQGHELGAELCEPTVLLPAKAAQTKYLDRAEGRDQEAPVAEP